MNRWQLCKIIFKLWFCAMLKPKETSRLMLLAGQDADPQLADEALTFIDKIVG